MNVVIFGAWHRSEQQDFKLVNQLLDMLKQKYGSSLVIKSTGCDRGVGKIVKNRCMPADKSRKEGEFKFFEVQVKIYGEDLSKAQLSELWRARNAMLHEWGEEFHIFTDNQRTGIAQDLLARCVSSGRPYAVYEIGEASGPKDAAATPTAFPDVPIPTNEPAVP